MTEYRIRPAVALGTSATLPVLCGLLIAFMIQPAVVGVPAGVIFALAAAWISFRKVRRRTLTVTEDALIVQRDDYRMIVPWRAITAVQRRRHQRLLNVEELVCSPSTLEPVDSRGRPSALPKGLAAHPARTRVMVSVYSKDWREGPIGQNVRALGIDT